MSEPLQLELTAQGQGFLRLGKQEIASLLLFVQAMTPLLSKFSQRLHEETRYADAELFARLAVHGTHVPFCEELAPEAKQVLLALQASGPAAPETHELPRFDMEAALGIDEHERRKAE